MNKWLILFLTGGAGTLARYGLTRISYEILGSKFPYGTLFVNLLGCFLIGLLTSLPDKKIPITSEMRLCLIIGFLGAFTTFSSFIYETGNMIKEGQTLLALGNVTVSIVIGFVVFWAGIWAGEML